MKEKREDYTPLFDEMQKPDTKGWVLLTDNDLKLLDEIREIREIVLDIEAPDYQISSRT
jgi:hypothetical protein